MDSNLTTFDETSLSVDFYAVQSLLITCIMVLAVIGNFIVCLVVWKTRSLDSATGIFVLSLAISDLLRGFTVMPFVLMTSVRFGVWGLSQRSCEVCGFTNTLFLNASVTTLGAVSIDRFLAIVKPLQYQQLMTLRVARLMLIGVWSISFAVATAPLIGWSSYRFVHQMSLCTSPWNEDLSYSLSQLVVTIVLPMMVLSWCYFYIFRVARKQQKQIFIAAYWVRTLDRDRSGSVDPTRASYASSAGGGGDYDIAGEIFLKVPGSPLPRPSQQQTNAPRSERKAAYTIFIVIGVFVFCILPKQILSTWARDDDGDHTTTCYVIAVSSIISFANSAANPFVYGILNRRFRRTFIEILTCYPYCAWLHPIRRFSDSEIPCHSDNLYRRSRGQSQATDILQYPTTCQSPNFFSSPMPARRACGSKPAAPKPPPARPASDIFTTLTSGAGPDRRTSLPFNPHSAALKSASPSSELHPRAEKYRRSSDPVQFYFDQEEEEDADSVISHAEIKLPRLSGPRIPIPPIPSYQAIGLLNRPPSAVSSNSRSSRRVSVCVEEDEEEMAGEKSTASQDHDGGEKE